MKERKWLREEFRKSTYWWDIMKEMIKLVHFDPQKKRKEKKGRTYIYAPNR